MDNEKLSKNGQKIIDLGCPNACKEVKKYNSIIKKKIVMPTIGNISVGKSYFLNSLLGFDLCQVKNEITTKFILFIRHIEDFKEPKLYNIKPIKNKNGSYDFIKDNEIFIGEKEIKEKIKEINNNNENNEKALFYMLEVKIESIQNKTFLNNVDFLDVPGLNESGIDYINLYFKYIKDMIKYCLIIFSTENYNSTDSLKVIKKVKNNINVPIKNFLLVLNKIDKIDGTIDETIHDFKKVFLNNEDINIYENIIIPMNSIELKSEIQIENNFYYFVNYYLIEYFKLNQELLSFLDFIKSKIKNLNQEKKKNLKNETKNLDDKIYQDIIKPNIKLLIEENIIKGHSLIIDVEEERQIYLLKMFYICFNKKFLIPKESNNLMQINDYFNKIEDYSFPTKIANITEDDNSIYETTKEHILLTKLDSFFTNSFSSKKLRKYGNIVPLLNDDFKVLNNYILNSSLLFIPVLGISNSGKSSFINCLLQKDILTCHSSECTRRGIIIRYIKEKDKISLYSIKFKSAINLNYKYYYYIKNKKLSEKENNIKEIINISNESFPKDEENSFFLLEINIPLLDDIHINPEIKNNICIIDFPGHNTHHNMFLEKKIYQNVLKMSSFFIYLNNGKAFKEDANKILLSDLCKEVLKNRIGDISPEQFIDSCLFVFNKADTLDKEEKDLKGISKDVKDILGIDNNFQGNISCSLFSSLLYKIFLSNKEEYQIEKIINLINKFHEKFNLQNEEIDDDELFDIEEKPKSFLDYFKKNFIEKVKNDFIEDDSLLNIDNIGNNYDNNDNTIYEILFDQMKKIDGEEIIKKESNYENKIKYISNILIFIKENPFKLKYYTISYAKDTFSYFKEKIIQSYELKRKEFDNHLGRFFYFMNIFFRLENKFEKNDAKKDYEKISKEFMESINNIFSEFKGKEIIKEYENKILKYIKEKKKDYKILMQENLNDVDNVIELLERKINKEIENFRVELEIELSKIENKIGKQMKDLGLSETGLIYRETGSQTSLINKIFLVSQISLLIFSPIAYGILRLGKGLFYSLPIYIYNKLKKERKFNKFMDEKQEYIQNLMNIYKNSSDENMKKFKEITIHNAKRLLGLLEASSIDIDEFWEKAKNEYIIIKDYYEKIKISNK